MHDAAPPSVIILLIKNDLYKILIKASIGYSPMIAAGAFPLIAGFSLALLVVLTIYIVGKRIAPKGSGAGGAKTDPYACGEDMPAEETQMNLERFLIFALFFLVFDVTAFMMATSYFTLGVLPIIYVSVIIVGVAALILSRGKA